MTKRLDVELSQLAGISRTTARELITAGCVRVNGVTAAKPGAQLRDTDTVEYDLPRLSYVSRGGHKLHAALDAFGVDLGSRVCLDVGASTGGFTDCMLQRGAALVYALDVGTAQLHPNLRTDERVRSIENTNILAVSPGYFDPTPSFAAIDVSFVSAAKILPHAAQLLGKHDAQIIVLVKPQFECGRAALSKRGVVRDKKAHQAAVEQVAKAGEDARLILRAVTESPIKGGDGNTEYLALFERNHT